jgi:hypothetical protein
MKTSKSAELTSSKSTEFTSAYLSFYSALMLYRPKRAKVDEGETPVREAKPFAYAFVVKQP